MDCPTWDGILLATAAVFAAALAALTAIWRQKKQLEAESERLARQLDAEASRLARQLQHDRELREDEETRKILDDAMRAATVAIETTAQLFGRSALDKARGEAGVDPRPFDPDEIVRESSTAMVELTGQGQRLRLRFGEEHELHLGYQRVLFAMQKSIILMGEGVLAGEDGPTTDAQEASQEAGERLKEFGQICKKYVGVGLKPRQ
jgi:hypothetical protein